MSRFNRFGKTYTDVLSMFPGTVAADFDAGGANGATNIQAAMDRATLQVSAALRPDVFRAITKVENELVVRYATAGQTSWTLGIAPVVAGSVHVWIYPLLAPAGGLGLQSNYNPYATLDAYYKPPTIGWLEVASADYSVTASTGAITYSGATTPLGSRVFASYDVDTDNASFSMPQLGQIVLLGAAAELGAVLYTEGNQEWALVTNYRDSYKKSISDLQEGLIIPDEVRKLSYWEEIERTSGEVRSFRLNRG